jgi:hypothetical protein
LDSALALWGLGDLAVKALRSDGVGGILQREGTAPFFSLGVDGMVSAASSGIPRRPDLILFQGKVRDMKDRIELLSRRLDRCSYWQLFLVILIFNESLIFLAWLVLRCITRLRVLQTPVFIVGWCIVTALAALAQFCVIYLHRRSRTRN